MAVANVMLLPGEHCSGMKSDIVMLCKKCIVVKCILYTCIMPFCTCVFKLQVNPIKYTQRQCWCYIAVINIPLTKEESP